MKKPYSGLGASLWVVGGLIGIYLAGGAILATTSTSVVEPWVSSLPHPVGEFLRTIYLPLFSVLAYLQHSLFP